MKNETIAPPQQMVQTCLKSLGKLCFFVKDSRLVPKLFDILFKALGETFLFFERFLIFLFFLSSNFLFSFSKFISFLFNKLFCKSSFLLVFSKSLKLFSRKFPILLPVHDFMKIKKTLKNLNIRRISHAWTQKRGSLRRPKLAVHH